MFFVEVEVICFEILNLAMFYGFMVCIEHLYYCVILQFQKIKQCPLVLRVVINYDKQTHIHRQNSFSVRDCFSATAKWLETTNLFSTRPTHTWKFDAKWMKDLSGAQLSQVKKSDCGIAQPNSCIADDNVLNKRGAGATARSEYSTNKSPWTNDRKTLTQTFFWHIGPVLT